MVTCPKCNSEMREGEVFAVSTYGFEPTTGLGMIGITGTALPSLETMREEKIQWREKTGRKTGFMKSEEQKIMKISGRRCVKCGYIELIAQE